jgi:hypothetical protein
MPKLVNLIGVKVGILTVKERADNRHGDIYWKCQCDCGNTIDVRADHLRASEIRSCGCITNAMIAQKLTKHGMRRTSLYSIWNTMLQRCENPNSSAARLYHDRAISVCNEWKNFENFKNWALTNGYEKGLTIDRIDNNGGYCPENCRWADLITQANNKRTNVRVEYNGEIKTLAQWAREFHIDYRVFWQRLKRGWNIERALTGASA